MSFRLKFPTNAFHFKRSRSGSEHSLCNKRRQTCLGFSSFSGSRIDNLNICLLTLIIEVFWPQNWKYSWKPNKTEDPWILVFLTSVLTGSQWFLSEQFFTGQSHGPRKRRPVTIWLNVALNNDDDTHEFIPCAYSTEPCRFLQFDIRQEAEAESGPQCDILKGGWFLFPLCTDADRYLHESISNWTDATIWKMGGVTTEMPALTIDAPHALHNTCCPRETSLSETSSPMLANHPVQIHLGKNSLLWEGATSTRPWKLVCMLVWLLVWPQDSIGPKTAF